MNVVIMIGPSGSGKSTYIENNLKDYFVCSADNFFITNGEYKYDPNKIGEAHQICLKSFIEEVQKGEKNIVVDNTNTSIEQLAPYYSIAKAYNYNVKFVKMECTSDICVNRNQHGVNKKTIDGMFFNFSRLRLPKYWNFELETVKSYQE